MKINLGFMKIPLEGPLNHALLTGGILWGCLWTSIVFNIAEIKGPAVNAKDGREFSQNCQGSLLVTFLWCIVYYNFVAVQVLQVFGKNAWEMFGDGDVTEKSVANASRYGGNMFEQSVVFLPTLWTYTIFCDWGTAWALGLMYIAGRLYYPFMYMINRQFKFWFEFCTQVGYGCVGVFLLGTVFTAAGGDWASWAKDNKIAAGIAGFFTGSLATLGFPLGFPYALIHYRFERMAVQAQRLKVDSE